MKIGFTGTKHGMTPKQAGKLIDLLSDFLDECPCLGKLQGHHGDCVGADQQFHMILLDFDDSYIVVHPPKNDKYRAFCEGYDEIREPKDYGVRDKDIVKETDFLIATPLTYGEQLRSGTWMTIRIARKLNKDIYKIWPDGKVEQEINNHREKLTKFYS
jgi:hypothetical protein